MIKFYAVTPSRGVVFGEGFVVRGGIFEIGLTVAFIMREIETKFRNFFVIKKGDFFLESTTR